MRAHGEKPCEPLLGEDKILITAGNSMKADRYACLPSN